MLNAKKGGVVYVGLFVKSGSFKVTVSDGEVTYSLPGTTGVGPHMLAPEGMSFQNRKGLVEVLPAEYYPTDGWCEVKFNGPDSGTNLKPAAP